MEEKEVGDISYQDCIVRVIEYIEQNLSGDLNNRELAQIAGYSEYHFLRVFREVVQLTPADYIRKRRISEIVRHMEGEERTISEIAYEYGFNSKENFVRAFKSEHHILPTEFRSSQNSLKLYERFKLAESEMQLVGRVEHMEGFRLVVYPCDESFPPNFWNKYNVNQWSKRLSGGRVVEDYGVSFRNPRSGNLDYYIGIKEENALGDLTGTTVLNVEGGSYAVFQMQPATHFSFVDMIHRTWDYIIRVWLPENGYERTGGYELEVYVEESRTFSETIYIPVRKRREKA